MPRLNLRPELPDLAVQFLEMVQQSLHEYMKCARQLIAGTFNQFRCIDCKQPVNTR